MLATEDENVFAPEFEKVVSRPPRVQTRPIRHDDVEEVGQEAHPVSPEVADAQNGSNGAKTQNTPIYLRRRWLADGGA